MISMDRCIESKTSWVFKDGARIDYGTRDRSIYVRIAGAWISANHGSATSWTDRDVSDGLNSGRFEIV